MGSSPRMRGTPIQGGEKLNTLGLIPAYAGNTYNAHPCFGHVGDHPRVRGEHGFVNARRVHGLGSSPRMRGTHDNGDMVHAAPGIIPAYAGNTEFETCFTDDGQDHPRVCGEHSGGLPALLRLRGSSPRMRGTLVERLVGRGLVGIIPAYAGNTSPQAAGRLTPSGSSPRMRGTQNACHDWFLPYGIIPAYAGNTRSPQIHTILDGDHPRVCGEHLHCNFHRSQKLGSSPRMRGTQALAAAFNIDKGIIPAYAGNTDLHSLLIGQIGDHPRVCGEHLRL